MKLRYVGSDYDFISKSRIEIHPDETFFRKWKWNTISVQRHFDDSFHYESDENAEQAKKLQYYEDRYWADADKYQKVLEILKDFSVAKELAGSLYVISSQSQMIKTLAQYNGLQSEAIQTALLKEALEKMAFNSWSVRSVTFEIDNDAIYGTGHDQERISTIRIDEEFVLVQFVSALVRRHSASDNGIDKYIDKSRIPFNDFDRIDNRNLQEFNLLYMADQLLREFAPDLREFYRLLLIASLFSVFEYFTGLRHRGNEIRTDEDKLDNIADAIRSKLTRGRSKYLKNSENKE